jgi:hypothetical protein
MSDYIMIASTIAVILTPFDFLSMLALTAIAAAMGTVMLD